MLTHLGQHAPKQTTPFEKMKNKDEAISKGEILERFRVYFPTERTVAESRGGIPVSDIALCAYHHKNSTDK